MRTLIRVFLVLLGSVLLSASSTGSRAWAQEAPAAGSKAASEIRDDAGMFASEAVTKAKAELARIEKTYHVPTTIETVESLRGEPIADVVSRRARNSGREGIYILLSMRDSKLDTLVSRRFREIITRADAESISQAFIKEFRERRFDQGLGEGVRAIETLLAKAKSEGKLATASSSLVLRNQVRLTLGGARKILEGAEAKASSMGLKMNIAVVDDGGHMIAFARMDGARPASGYTATTKAVTAATFRQASGPLPPGAATPDVLLNVSLQNAAAASGGKLTTLYGGVPVVVDGQVIGGVGVGGGTGEQDATVARAGIETLMAELGEAVPAGKKELGVPAPGVRIE